MITKDFVKDIELYICEKFGYRNSVYVIAALTFAKRP